MNFNILYLLNNKIYYLSEKNKDIIVYNMPKNTMLYSKINNYKTFQKYFEKMLSDNKLLKVLSNGNIKVITNNLYTEVDNFFLKEVLKELNFNKILLYKESKILNDYKNKVYIVINDEVLFINYKHNNQIVTSVFINYFQMFDFLNDYLNKNFNNYKIFIGNNSNEDLKGLNVKHYIYQEYPVFLINLLYKMDN